jgi:hypothetical protein
VNGNEVDVVVVVDMIVIVMRLETRLDRTGFFGGGTLLEWTRRSTRAYCSLTDALAPFNKPDSPQGRSYLGQKCSAARDIKVSDQRGTII